MNNESFIKLNRKILEWEWYDDLPTFRLFMHLLIKANWKEKKWHGVTIKRGQLLTSQQHLAEETGLSRQQVRTSLEKLISTNEITKSASAKYTIITIKNYNKYQDNNQANNQVVTNKQPSGNQVATTTKEYKNNKNDKKDDISVDISSKEKESKKKFIPPTINQVRDYCLERKNRVDAEQFIDFYSSKGWMVGKNKMKDWKACIRNWERRDRKNKKIDSHDYNFDELERQLARANK